MNRIDFLEKAALVAICAIVTGILLIIIGVITR
jgi:hypothetical protein